MNINVKINSILLTDENLPPHTKKILLTVLNMITHLNIGDKIEIETVAEEPVTMFSILLKKLYLIENNSTIIPKDNLYDPLDLTCHEDIIYFVTKLKEMKSNSFNIFLSYLVKFRYHGFNYELDNGNYKIFTRKGVLLI